MNPFALTSVNDFADARARLVRDDYSLPMLKAGGMDVVDHIKEGLMEPDLLIDVRKASANNGGPTVSRTTSGQLRIEANASLAEIGGSDVLLKHAPVVSQACHSAATPQVRNVASAAGNLLQRPRCWYYRNAAFDCLKKGGHMCYAVEGENKFHAVFGDGPCHIVHPSNLALALHVCNGRIHLESEQRDHIDMTDLYHMPDRGIRDEHNLGNDEVITHMTFDAAPNSGFYAVKEKQSFDWPLVMAGVALEINGTTIARARVCAGAVAPVPWDLPQVAKALQGLDVNDDDALRSACARSTAGAQPMSDNEYKLRLLPVAVHRAIKVAAGRMEAH